MPTKEAGPAGTLPAGPGTAAPDTAAAPAAPHPDPATSGVTAEAASVPPLAGAPVGAGLPSLRDTVARHGLDARKALGQHFLLDQNICVRVAGQAGDLSGRHVVEVGPGPGGLTRALVDSAAAHVTAIELDRRAIAVLTELGEARPGRLTVIEGDALKVDAAALTGSPRCVVANLPYNVGTALLVHWLEEAERWESLTLMFQQEVAARIVAAPDTEGYGRLSVLAQWRCEARMVLTLPPGAFSPPPKVWSAVVHLRPRATQPEPALAAAMGRLTAAAFGQRRKMLRGSLKSLGGAEALLEAGGIEPTRRAETLSVAEFEGLARVLLARGAG